MTIKKMPITNSDRKNFERTYRKLAPCQLKSDMAQYARACHQFAEAKTFDNYLSCLAKEDFLSETAEQGILLAINSLSRIRQEEEEMNSPEQAEFTASLDAFLAYHKAKASE